MNYQTLLARLSKLGLNSSRQVAEMLDNRRDHSAIVRWCNGRRKIPPEFECIVNLLIAGKITQADVTKALRK